MSVAEGSRAAVMVSLAVNKTLLSFTLYVLQPLAASK